MLRQYPAVRKVDKPDDEELIAVVSALINRANDLYQITCELKNELKGDTFEVPVQLINPLAINKTNVPDYLRMIAYLTNVTRKELTIIENQSKNSD